MNQQTTIEKEVEITGRGLFSSKQVTVRFRPAEPDTGRVFFRKGGDGRVPIPARIEHLAPRSRRTSLRNGTVAIETVEHCLAACVGLGIDNLQIEVDGDELPGGDGSSAHFVQVLQSGGLVEQPVAKRVVKVAETVRVARGDAELVALPCDEPGLHIIYELDYGAATAIGRQVLAVDVTPDVFASQIAAARTFVLEAEAMQLRQAGLGEHLTYQDILVFGPSGPIENELRWADECVRHKIQDLIGDLALSDCCLQARIYARRSGHALNHELIKRILEAHEAQEVARRPTRAEPVLDIRRIQRILPHRYPFLLLDRVIELDEDRRAVAIKNVTINEEFFEGHYPGHPIMPGVLILEAMAQLGGVLLSQKLEHTGKVAVLLSMDKVKFRRPVVPGDQLILEAETARVKSRTGHVMCKARVGKEVAAEAVIRFMMVDADPI